MLFFVCALHCEAAPLITCYHLKAFPSSTLYPIFFNGDVYLVISGIGKMRAALAVGYLFALSGGREHSAWVNVGIGGHRTKEIGEGGFIHQVTDQGGGLKFYPTFTWRSKNPTFSLITVDKVENDYNEDPIYDMEGSGFCTGAFQCTTAEMVHCYKVVSDNAKHPPKKDPSFATGLIDSHLEKIQEGVELLRGVQKTLFQKPTEELPRFFEKWRLTATQKVQVGHLLKRWEILSSTSIWDAELEQKLNPKEMIAYLNQKVRDVSLHLL